MLPNKQLTMTKQLRELCKCKVKDMTSNNAKADGTCSKQPCPHEGQPGCAVAELQKILLPISISLTDNIRKQLASKKFGKELMSEDKVAELLRKKPLWDVAEEVYGIIFDHTDRETWLFYSKVNRIRKKYNIPRVVPGAVVTK